MMTKRPGPPPLQKRPLHVAAPKPEGTTQPIDPRDILECIDAPSPSTIPSIVRPVRS
jgi:hypothetical protein